MEKALEEAKQDLKDEIKALEEQLCLLDNFDFDNVVSEEQWHQICETSLRSSDKVLEKMVLNIFPLAKDIKVTPNFVNFSYKGFDCAIPTSRNTGVLVDMSWYKSIYIPQKVTYPFVIQNMKLYFEKVEEGATWEELFDIRIRNHHLYKKWQKCILWFGWYKWKRIDKEYWEKQIESENLKFDEMTNKNRQLQDEQHKRVEFFMKEVYPDLMKFSNKLQWKKTYELNLQLSLDEILQKENLISLKTQL